jgi:hypothetical protein
MTATTSAVGSTVRQRWRTLRWVLLALGAIVVISVISTYLTAPRPGGRMDPQATSPDGAHALVALLRDQGVDVVVAEHGSDVERALRPDALLLVAQTDYLVDADVLQRLAALPGDRLLVEPVSRTLEAMAPAVHAAVGSSYGGKPGCDMREAQRAGAVELGLSATYEATGDTSLTRCYDNALVRYSTNGRTMTVVGSADFMTNSGLLNAGNAALAMNLAGTHSRVVWYAPQRVQGESATGTSILDAIPDRVWWMVLQLIVVVALVALWQSRRLGPLVAERLPVVVRASETVEGRGRLYRSHRARDRAADALRTATLHRTLPRLGLGPQAEPAAIVQSIALRTGGVPSDVEHWLYGPSPATDTELVELSRGLDDIERKVARS